MSTMNLNQVLSVIKENGHKLTPQRRYIIEIMMKNNQEHWSTEEIYDEVKKVCPEIGIATVYRTIQMLEELDLLTKHHFSEGCSRYEFTDETKDHNHHHIVCTKCGKVMEIQDTYFDELERHIQDDINFNITNHTVTFYGVCKDCKE